MQHIIEKQKTDNRQEKVIGFCEDSQTGNIYLKFLSESLPVYIPISVQHSIDYETLIRLFRDIRFYRYQGIVDAVTDFPNTKDFQLTDEYPTELNIREKRISKRDKFLSELDFLSFYTSDLASNKLSNTSVTVRPSSVKVTGNLHQKDLTWNLDTGSDYYESLSKEKLQKSDLYVLHKSDVSEETEYVSADSTDEWLLLTDLPRESMESHKTLLLILALLYIITAIMSYAIFGFTYPLIY